MKLFYGEIQGDSVIINDEEQQDFKSEITEKDFQIVKSFLNSKKLDKS